MKTAFPQGPAVREVTTPEGVPLRFVVAPIGDRAAAFLIDLVVPIGIVLVIVVLAMFASIFTKGSEFAAAAILMIFLLRNFYFVWFELRWNGTTPGKRKIGLRVVDYRGGPLTAEAVFTRNFLREVEVFIPLVLLAAPEQMWPGANGPVRLAAIAWVFVFAALPLFNRERRRAGDLAAGTIVVVAPEHVLLPDLTQPQRSKEGASAQYAFTAAQLSVYGEFELQVLEDLLRRSDGEGLGLVCRKIQTKIGWPRERRDVDVAVFLREFYAAQRAALEQRMLFGRRKQDKHDAGAPPT
jgi:uncharacterized RDD family membrane protein YckC